MFQQEFDNISVRFPSLVHDFLREFESGHIEGPLLIRTQALHSALQLMAYTFEEHFP